MMALSSLTKSCEVKSLACSSLSHIVGEDFLHDKLAVSRDLLCIDAPNTLNTHCTISAWRDFDGV